MANVMLGDLKEDGDISGIRLGAGPRALKLGIQIAEPNYVNISCLMCR
jgi:hypothetical protein